MTMMESNKLRRISWRRAHELPSRSVLVSLMDVLNRSTPVPLQVMGSIFYGGIEDPASFRPYGAPVEKPLEFARARWYSNPIARVGIGFFVRPYIASLLKKFTNFSFGPAKCVGLLDVDPLDYLSMSKISIDLAGCDLSIHEFIRDFGVVEQDSDWMELIAPVGSAGDHFDGPVFDFPLVALVTATTPKSDGSQLVMSEMSPFRLKMLDHYGMVSGRFHIMRLDVADFFLSFLPAPFWEVAYWEVY